MFCTSAEVLEMSTAMCDRCTDMSAVSMRLALASRIAQATPSWWLHASSSAGVSGADAFLIHLGRSITNALQSVAESAAAARSPLNDARWVLHSAIDARIELIARTPTPAVGDSLVAHRISDGSVMGSLKVTGLCGLLAADPTTGTVFGSVKSVEGLVIHSWKHSSDPSVLIAAPRLNDIQSLLQRMKSRESGHCSSSATLPLAVALPQMVAPGIRISPGVPVAAASAARASYQHEDVQRPLAVVPPVPGKKVSHLVVVGSVPKELLVLSLPDLVLMHTHILEGMEVKGLAADPWGGALVVCDAVFQSVHVMAWPLPGMLPLE